MVRTYAVQNINANEIVLLSAMNHKLSSVRHAAAASDKATEIVLIQAIKDENEGVRRAAKRNPNTTSEILKAHRTSNPTTLTEPESSAFAHFGIRLG